MVWTLYLGTTGTPIQASTFPKPYGDSSGPYPPNGDSPAPARFVLAPNGPRLRNDGTLSQTLTACTVADTASA
ncbi:hypothetical protein IscW_ISCW001889 [Ixodes scapularis]|uniref:Uncharacterized protein n=1 Tax=Ixodes scapularis TaxID=6945 RepID=B7PAP0_IXOSC|nr:hypothetical protein IscW_ISCW001889 [Ixodes scapularis]|eukprot:XP_002407073.1 hypothetical protein IscW_ISCW001889 [Ixodes scapularis]